MALVSTFRLPLWRRRQRRIHANGRVAVRAMAVAAAVGVMSVVGGGLGTLHAQSAPPDFAARAEDPKDFPAGSGRDDTFYACSACHAFRLVTQQGLSRERWDETLTYMTERHKMQEITGKDRTAILNYLAATYGPKGRGTRGWNNQFTN